MCGLAGFLLLRQSLDQAELVRRLEAMVAMVRHRGPDHESVWTDGVAGFGFARLSIIAPGADGNQPLHGPDSGLVMVCNGEIYNFIELRRELEALGHRFAGGSDAEVVLHGYESWGEGVFHRLRGMFAIAIYDTRRHRLVLARDRIGKKPLHYADLGGTLIFGSEIKALLAWPGVERRPDLGAIHHYLTFQYVPGALTAFEGINRLEPGQMLVREANGTSTVSSYAQWSAPAVTPSRPDDVEARLRHMLDDAVRVRMRSDVPVGAFLSGGIDSSLVVALMARHASQPIQTFSLGFDDPAVDERPFARMLAAHCGTRHHEVVLRPELSDLIYKLAWHFDQPFADSSAIPTFLLARFAARHVKVAMTGDGGDETFIGYTRYEACHAGRWAEHFPMPLRRLARRAAEAIPAGAEIFRPARVARRWLARFDERESRRYAPVIAYLQEIDKRIGYGDALRPFLRQSSLERLETFFQAARDPVDGAAWADLHTYLPDDLLVKVDVATMACGLEARSPFLDPPLVEWAAALPAAIKAPGGQLKNLLKRVAVDLIPAPLLDRPKAGFRVPLRDWLARDLNDMARTHLLSRRMEERGLFRRDWVERLFLEHESGRMDHRTRLWALLMLEMWFQTWIDRPIRADI